MEFVEHDGHRFSSYKGRPGCGERVVTHCLDSMRRADALCAVICLFTALAAPSAFTQFPRFEAASIRPSPESHFLMTVGPELRTGSFEAQRVTLRILLAGPME
jgi:hypothetical protein